MRNIDLQIPKGVTGILGPNGAGKSVLLRLLATVNAPTEGRVTWHDRNVWRERLRYRAKLGYAPQSANFPEYATARDALYYCAALKKLDSSVALQLNSLSRRLNMGHWLSTRVGDLSGGMRRRLLVAQAFLGDPEVILLDEPSAELDTVERRSLYRLIADSSHDKTILVSTHLADELEAVASHLIVIARGQLLFCGSASDLLGRVRGRTWLLHIAPDELERLEREHIAVDVRRQADKLRVRVVADRCPPAAITEENPTIQDAYIATLLTSDRAAKT